MSSYYILDRYKNKGGQEEDSNHPDDSCDDQFLSYNRPGMCRLLNGMTFTLYE